MRSRISTRGLSPLALGLLAAASSLVVLAPSDATAQITGTNSKPLPNVLLLVDTSGSMERLPDGKSPDDPAFFPVNKPCDGTTANYQPTRWHILVQALTGSVQSPTCQSIDRKSAEFSNEFQINSKMPPDKDYSLNWHRLVSGATTNGCTIAPYKMGGGNVSSANRRVSGANDKTEAFPPESFMEVKYSNIQSNIGAYNPTAANQYECPFAQASDGQLDNVRDFIRLGLMTFDSDPYASTPSAIDGTSSFTSGSASSTPFDGEWSYVATGGPRVGRPAGCSTDQLFDVGARHRAAPPWEGRMIGFPTSTAQIFDIERGNDQIQKVLLGSRAYGATPIDGMMEDAQDYLTINTTYGPRSGSEATGQDYFVQGGCREQYIILLTDGAPNLDMRPSCQGLPPNKCPYPNSAAQTAYTLYTNPTGKQVKTFVIGFSVNGTANFPDAGNGFPAAYVTYATGLGQTPSCSGWYNAPTIKGGGGGTPTGMTNACTLVPPIPPIGSTAAACCTLNEIAVKGSNNTQGAFFAESQADLNLAFSSVLASVVRTASTRTVPGYSPVASYGSSSASASYVASFIPNTQKAWSGEINRTRSTCAASGFCTVLPGSPPYTCDPSVLAEGDSFAFDTSSQAAGKGRLFITVKDSVQLTGAIDSAGTIRPFNSFDDKMARSDGSVQAIGALEVGKQETSVTGGVLSVGSNWDLAMGIDSKSCKKSQGVDPLSKATVQIPPLSASDCVNNIWGFTTATTDTLKFGSSPWEYNVRCPPTSASSPGTCSISGTSCAPPGIGCPVGEACVPAACSALGAIYRSSPVVAGPPASFSSDEGYRNFTNDRGKRRAVLYVQTADGILHGFKALPDVATPTSTTTNELWAFVPPAMLPRLQSNYPAGAQILLDGTPAVKDTVWDRDTQSILSPPQKEWHTTLVSGLGINGGGYYAVNVTDADCNVSSTSQGQARGCMDGTSTYQQPSTNDATGAGTNGLINAGGTSRGPHFLWQLTDTPAQTTEQAAAGRTAPGTGSKKMVSLFGKQTGTPAITTLNILSGGTEHQVGVAILPGGIDGPPTEGISCSRGVTPGGAGDASDRSFLPRGTVRCWGTTPTSAVNGRGVTIVRLDNGQIIKHFGRSTDVPSSFSASTLLKPTNFDAPIIGTPVVYPNSVDTSAQKIFVGDADGTVWRIDVSSNNTNNWVAEIFADLANASAGGGAFDSGQPIQIPMSVSTAPNGNLVLNVATGDQENIVANAATNWLYSIEEQRPDASVNGGRGIAKVRWYKTFANAERVTGPMVVFDRNLYFATYKPEPATSGSACTNASNTRLWGMDYLTDSGTAGAGGAPRWCGSASNNGSVRDPSQISSSGACRVQPYIPFEDVGGIADGADNIPIGSIIPGVTVKATQSCVTNTVTGDPASGYATIQPVEYRLSFGVTSSRTGGGSNSGQASRLSPRISSPRVNTSIDAWAIVVD